MGDTMGVDERTRWFREARFGMFIHWNLFSVTGQGGWELRRGWTSRSEWDAAADRFTPRRFDPSSWARLAVEAGMQYAVLTTMSCDGFAIFDSPVSDFTSAKRGARRDFVREYVEAFRAAGLRVGLYYSLTDWMWQAHRVGPAADPEGWRRYVDHIHENVRHLCTAYGPVDILWFDTQGPRTPEDYRARELLDMARSLQPGILINDRSSLPDEADFVTPEQTVGKYLGGRAWESCITMTDHWPWTQGDRNWRTQRQLFKLLAGCAAGGGNLLLNVGPTPDGFVPAPAVKRLTRIGAWLDRYGGAVYGTDFCPVCRCPYTAKTMKGNRIFLLIDCWPRDGTYHLMDFPHRKDFDLWRGWEPLVLPEESRTGPSALDAVKAVRVLPDGQRLTVEPRGDGVLLRGLPSSPPDEYLSVIAMDLDPAFVSDHSTQEAQP
jgi:alpha-L-fucosidase